MTEGQGMSDRRFLTGDETPRRSRRPAVDKKYSRKTQRSLRVSARYRIAETAFYAAELHRHEWPTNHKENRGS
jgi:hypothetical protein